MTAPLYLINMFEHETEAERVFGMLIDRHNSFEDYPIDNDAFINNLIINGFKYTHVEDAVVCEYCGVVIKNWCENDNVEFVHATLSPFCVYANKIAQNEQFDGHAATTNAIVVSPGKPRCVYGQLKRLNARRATFKDHWPTALSVLAQKIAEAGMFYSMLGDETICFFCDCRVRDWLPNDDPWQRHALVNPNCHFVVCMKGDEFCNSVQRAELTTEEPETTLVGNETLECKICLEHQRDAVLMPCRHFCICMQCYFALDGKCPTCRQDVTDFVKVFVS